MSSHSVGIFREFRNLNRKASILAKNHDIITSAKEFKRIRSSQQLNINNFMNNKNEKMRNLDEKLDIHQNQIIKNNKIITELTQQFLIIKDQYTKEKQKTQQEERKNKLLRQEIDRTSKLLKAKTNKVQQLTKIKQNLQKQIESIKPILIKNQQNLKIINTLKKQITLYQETSEQSKKKFQDKQKQFIKMKQKLTEINIIKTKNQQLIYQTQSKEKIINDLKASLKNIKEEKDRNNSQKNFYQKQTQNMNKQIQQLNKNKSALQKQYQDLFQKNTDTNKKLQQLQYQNNTFQSKAISSQSEESRARNQLKQIKQKHEELIIKFNEKNNQLEAQNNKIQKFIQKVKELELKLIQTKEEKSKLSQVQIKFQDFKRKSRNLQSLYNQISPQIQCPFGHQLVQPITIIPCGHNYCIGCKKGYQKQCYQCKGKLKIQAVYRNELMDDIINIIGGIRQVVELVK